jgi:hypothetical protein
VIRRLAAALALVAAPAFAADDPKAPDLSPLPTCEELVQSAVAHVFEAHRQEKALHLDEAGRLSALANADIGLARVACPSEAALKNAFARLAVPAPTATTLIR